MCNVPMPIIIVAFIALLSATVFFFVSNEVPIVSPMCRLHV